MIQANRKIDTKLRDLLVEKDSIKINDINFLKTYILDTSLHQIIFKDFIFCIKNSKNKF